MGLNPKKAKLSWIPAEDKCLLQERKKNDLDSKKKEISGINITGQIVMEMEKVAEEILKEAEKKAASVIDSGESEKEKVLDEARKRIALRKAEMKKNMDEFVSGLCIREMTKAKLAIKKRTQDARNEILDIVYKKSMEELLKDRKSLIKKLIEMNKGFDAKTIYVNKEDYKVAKELFGNVVVSDISGGIILENADSRETIDMRLERIGQLVRDATIKDVSRILFGGK